MYDRDVVGYCHLRLSNRCRHPAPGQDFIPLQRLHVFAHSRDPHPTIELWCPVLFSKSKIIFQIEMHCMQCFLESKYIKSRTYNHKNRWIIKKSYDPQEAASSSCHQGHLLPWGLKVRWSMMWGSIGVPSSDVPAEVELLHLRIERHEEMLHQCVINDAVTHRSTYSDNTENKWI